MLMAQHAAAMGYAKSGGHDCMLSMHMTEGLLRGTGVIQNLDGYR